MSILDSIVSNPLMKSIHERRRARLVEIYPELIHCSRSNFLSLWQYIALSPQKYYSVAVYSAFYEWLNERHQSDTDKLLVYFHDKETELNRAILHLREINRYQWHDSFQTEDDYEMIRYIDDFIHPTYLRLVEAVFTPLLRLVAWFTRIDREAQTDGLDTSNIVQELRDGRLNEATECYRHIVRNGIAHGGITFLQDEIQYQDKRGNEEVLSCSEILRITDDILDTCNALVLAVSVFLIIHQSSGYNLPQQLLIDELREETNTPWWEITGCVPSRITNLNQLIIYAKVNTADYQKVFVSVVHTGILTEYYASGYDRYHLSFRSKTSLPGWAGFDGTKLRALRESNVTKIEDYAGVIENNLVFFVPRRKLPRWTYKLETLLLSFKCTWPNTVQDFRKQLGIVDVRARDAKIHRNGSMCVLNGAVVIGNEQKEIDKDIVRKSCKRIVRAALRLARKNKSITDTCRVLPLGYARISVLRKDYRHRRLKGFDLGDDLICTIQERRLRRIQSPDIWGSTIEQWGRFRIAWNKAWLDSVHDDKPDDKE